MIKKWLLKRKYKKIMENNSRDFLKLCDLAFKGLYAPFTGLLIKDDAE